MGVSIRCNFLAFILRVSLYMTSIQTGPATVEVPSFHSLLFDDCGSSRLG